MFLLCRIGIAVLATGLLLHTFASCGITGDRTKEDRFSSDALPRGSTIVLPVNFQHSKGRATPQSSISFDITTRKPADKVEPETKNDTTTLTITSHSGIGNATLSPRKGQWPKNVVVRLQLKGLEALTLSNGKITLVVSVPSHGEQKHRVFLKAGNQETPIGKDDPKWMEVKLVGGKKVPLKDGYFEVALPAVLFKDSKALTISWIDFYR